MKDAGITNVDFVGSMSGPASCTLDGTAVQFDKNHEGHSGARVTDYAAKGNLTGWLSSAKPDMILMHVGTNDVIARIATADIIKAYGTLLGQMRASNPDMVLVVSCPLLPSFSFLYSCWLESVLMRGQLSKLIPIDPKVAGQAVSDDVGKLNTAMEEFVRSNTQQQSPIVLVDMTGFDTKTMTKEGEHPNEAGDKFMADRYFSTVKDALVVSSVQKMLTA